MPNVYDNPATFNLTPLGQFITNPRGPKLFAAWRDLEGNGWMARDGKGFVNFTSVDDLEPLDFRRLESDVAHALASNKSLDPVPAAAFLSRVCVGLFLPEGDPTDPDDVRRAIAAMDHAAS